MHIVIAILAQYAQVAISCNNGGKRDRLYAGFFCRGELVGLDFGAQLSLLRPHPDFGRKFTHGFRHQSATGGKNQQPRGEQNPEH
jgi:hypothetical protein